VISGKQNPREYFQPVASPAGEFASNLMLVGGRNKALKAEMKKLNKIIIRERLVICI
jgi:hypothetical protein